MTVTAAYTLAGRAMIIHVLVALTVLLGHVYLAGPISVMLYINLFGLILALAIIVFFLSIAVRVSEDLENFLSAWFLWSVAGILFFVLWGGFWAIGEELLTLWNQNYGYDGDMGASYFYTNLAGMGYGRGLAGVWDIILKMGILGLVSSLLAAPCCYVGVLAKRGVRANSL